jgi:enoyl-CoA hydratase/carnithine racemase
VILTGEGGSFCAGADISEFAKVRSNPQQVTDYERAVDGCCDAISACRKPTIAAINGFCIGGGMNVAMACDFRYANQTALLGIPAAKLSIIYGIKGTRRLYDLVGLTNAKWVLFSGKTLSAADAHIMGLVDKVASSALDAALQFADDLETNAPLSIEGAKRLLDSLASGGTPLTANQIKALIDEAAASYDYAEGRKAFAEKRPPRFIGR